MSEGSAPLLLRLLTPEGSLGEIGCDGIRLTLADDSAGRGGGAMGIKKGHTQAVLALGDGPLRASLGGKLLFSARVRGGFAGVKDDIVTVLADEAEIDESRS